MKDKKNKILILIDGSEELENSLTIVTETNLLKYDQIVLFFVLNPFNPITKGQETEVLYNDFVHDHGRRLATLYIEKLEKIIYEKNPNIQITNNLVNSYENLNSRLGLDDIDLVIYSVKFSNKLDYIFNKSKNIKYLLETSKNLLIFPYNFLHDSTLKNNLLVIYSDDFVGIDFNYLSHSFNLDKITFLYDRKSKPLVENFIDEIPEKTHLFEILEINSNIFNNINLLKEDCNLILSRESKRKLNLWENFSKDSNFNFFVEKIPLFFSNNF